MISAVSTNYNFLHFFVPSPVISANDIHVVSFEQTSCYLQIELHNIWFQK